MLNRYAELPQHRTKRGTIVTTSLKFVNTIMIAFGNRQTRGTAKHRYCDVLVVPSWMLPPNRRSTPDQAVDEEFAALRDDDDVGGGCGLATEQQQK